MFEAGYLGARTPIPQVTWARSWKNNNTGEHVFYFILLNHHEIVLKRCWLLSFYRTIFQHHPFTGVHWLSPISPDSLSSTQSLALWQTFSFSLSFSLYFFLFHFRNQSLQYCFWKDILYINLPPSSTQLLYE